MDLEDLTVDSFAPLAGSELVAVGARGGDDVVLVLEAVRVTGPPWREGARAPFNLYLRGPADLVLPQRIYALRHPALGEVPVFLVPVGRDSAGVLYEAVFS
jgi:hypothetical protein